MKRNESHKVKRSKHIGKWIQKDGTGLQKGERESYLQGVAKREKRGGGGREGKKKRAGKGENRRKEGREGREGDWSVVGRRRKGEGWS